MSAHNEPHSATGHAHHGGPLVYTSNLVGLLILTCITVGASYVNFGSSQANVVIALTIATMKAILVALFFMHLRWDKPVNAIIMMAGFLFLGIFLMFDLLDLDNRRDPTPRNVPVMAAPTPTPDTMNPLTTPAPKPYVAPAKPAGEGEAEEHK
ncbi:MAG: cytochrome C oxidase subunit IV family protein [Acidobacteriota bacterium]